MGKTTFVSTMFFLSILIAAFQNCAVSGGDGEGTTVDNPLNVNDRQLKVGFSAYENPGINIKMCVEKVVFRIESLEDPIDVPATGYIVIGTVIDINLEILGEVRVHQGYDGKPTAYSWFKDTETRLVELEHSLDTPMFELAVPNGSYSELSFVIRKGCIGFGDNSLTVTNSNGSFSHEDWFALRGTDIFNIEQSLLIEEYAPTQQLSEDIDGVNSSSELSSILFAPPYRY